MESVENGLMRILEVVHGFPPATEGGTELYAQAHARALREDGGNEIVVLTREHEPSRAEYDVRTEERDGLRIVWVNNTFRTTRTFEETYRNDAVGDIASRLIEDFKPNVAHIHQLTGLSTTIVRSLADRHIPCFLTLHDYWLLCHRGQLLDVNYRVCDGPPCHACLGPAAGAGAVGFIGARRFARSKGICLKRRRASCVWSRSASRHSFRTRTRLRIRRTGESITCARSAPTSRIFLRRRDICATVSCSSASRQRRSP